MTLYFHAGFRDRRGCHEKGRKTSPDPCRSHGRIIAVNCVCDVMWCDVLCAEVCVSVHLFLTIKARRQDQVLWCRLSIFRSGISTLAGLRLRLLIWRRFTDIIEQRYIRHCFAFKGTFCVVPALFISYFPLYQSWQHVQNWAVTLVELQNIQSYLSSTL